MSGLDEFNGLGEDAVRQVLRHCCSSARWVDMVAAGRPYSRVEELLGGSDAAVAEMSEAALREALTGHPRLGDHAAGGPSAAEQAAVLGADAGVLRELAEGNALYERRFGHVYLACATGRSASELIALLRDRLGNDREAEWRVVAAELAAINRVRLRDLVGAGT